MGKWWKRSVVSSIAVASVMAGLMVAPTQASADSVSAFQVSGAPNGATASERGSVTISTFKKDGNTRIDVRFAGRTEAVTANSPNRGYCDVEFRMGESPGYLTSKRIKLDSHGDGYAFYWAGVDARKVTVGGWCASSTAGRARFIYPEAVVTIDGGAAVVEEQEATPVPPLGLGNPGDYTVDDCRNLPDNLERDLTPEGFAPWDWAEYVGNPFSAALIASVRVICGGLAGATGDQEAADQLYCEAFVGAVWMLGGNVTNKLIANKVPGNGRLDADDIDNVLDVIDPSGQVQRVVEATGLKSVIGSDACRRTEGYPSVR